MGSQGCVGTALVLYRSVMRLGFGEILVVLVIALLVFGPSKLPQLGEALGKGIRSFKKAVETDDPVHEPSAKSEQAQLNTGTASAPQTPVSAESKKA